MYAFVPVPVCVCDGTAGRGGGYVCAYVCVCVNVCACVRVCVCQCVPVPSYVCVLLEIILFVSFFVMFRGVM